MGALEPGGVATNYSMCQVLTQHFPDTVMFNDLNSPTLVFLGPLYCGSALVKGWTVAHLGIGCHEAAPLVRAGGGLATPALLAAAPAPAPKSNLSLNARLEEGLSLLS